MRPVSVTVSVTVPVAVSVTTLTRWAARLPWPLPALLVWAGGWVSWLVLTHGGMSPAWAFGLALAGSTAAALACAGRWRRGIAAAGFPLSALALGAAGALPPWVWLLLLLPVLALYPVRAWRDAPLFPTPPDALAGLDAVVGMPLRVHDAGCGLGHGLVALHRLWPQARCSGVEWSPLLAMIARWRCRAIRIPAQVRRGDMWAASWAEYDLVYLFQRPESMARAFDKARAEMAPGAWLVSLEFPVPTEVPAACLQGEGRRPLWVYQPVPVRHPSTLTAGGR